MEDKAARDGKHVESVSGRESPDGTVKTRSECLGRRETQTGLVRREGDATRAATRGKKSEDVTRPGMREESKRLCPLPAAVGGPLCSSSCPDRERMRNGEQRMTKE